MKKKKGKRFIAPVAFVQNTTLDCPKCGSKLKSNPGQLPPLYFCTNCGYHGTIGLEPKKKRRKR